MLLKIISSNIRFDNPNDNKHLWQYRLPILSKTINDFCPCLIGSQEGRIDQLKEFSSLIENTSMVTNHRQWIKDRMYPTIYLKNNRQFTIIQSNDFWLSLTPEIPDSSSFSSAFPRLCTWTKIGHQDLSKPFFIFNCHLDHIKHFTREKQTEVLVEQIKIINNLNYPFLLMGDFNEGPQHNVRKIIMKSFNNLYDPWDKLKIKEEGTHHKFTGDNSNTERIDWILATNDFSPKKISLEKYNENNIWPSDHFPVKAEFKAIF